MQYNCPVCPNNCIIAEGRTGLCGVRANRDGKAFLPYHGILSAVSTDPIEKKPLYHYHPGKRIFSIGFYGCSLSCPFCQNYRISKEFDRPAAEYVSPAELVKSAVRSGSFGIAYTYSEPIVHLEYIMETAVLASSRGLKNVLVTNGYINPEPGRQLLEVTDAVNIDLKSFNPVFYRKELKAQLEPVLNFITMADGLTHVEVTTLVIPGKNDSESEIEKCAEFIAEINENIPYHLSAYYPSYKYSAPPTAPDALMRLAERASEKLNFVYTGNITGGISNTICPDCGNLLISRSGYSTSVSGLKDGICSSCGRDFSQIIII